jgi:hypothetical protein
MFVSFLLPVRIVDLGDMDTLREKAGFGQKTTEKPFDPRQEKAEIWQGIKGVLDESREHLYEVGSSLQVNPISFVFEASLEDGLALAKYLRLTPEEITQFTLTGGSSFFREKHEKVLEQARTFLRLSGVTDDSIEPFMDGTQKSRDTGEKMEQSVARRDDISRGFSPEMQDVLKKIQTYYAHFLPFRAEELAREGKKNPYHPPSAQSASRRELFNQKKKNQIRQAENILFDTYL